tara:strand:- start:1052 stop:2326 length:1275 start_codon:yes stop_codon:yes gene_type:complete
MNDSINIDHWANTWLIENGISATTAPYLTIILDLLILLIASYIIDFVAKKVILRVVGAYVRRSKNEYDDIFLHKKVFNGLAHLIPAVLIYNFIPYIFDDLKGSIVVILQKVIVFYAVIVFLNVMTRFFRSLEEIGLNSKRFEGKPISSYIQLFILISYIIGGVFMLSMVVGKSPLTILASFGAATAVILLIFRDTILGLVASIQISANDMVRLGDWVGLEKYGADGTVTEINLTTVKIRNWDKTITTVPTYAFISDSFKNWRGMENTGLRRIKRHIYIDLNSIKFVSDEMFGRFSKIRRVADYLKKRQAEIDEFNSANNLDTSVLINGRHLTNIGVFRRYALKYLEEHPNIDQKETVMVRQLQPTEKGLALEIYAFSNDIAWVNYENIQSDIFDHLFSAIEMFDLKLFQNPSGSDFRSLNLNGE